MQRSITLAAAAVGAAVLLPSGAGAQQGTAPRFVAEPFLVALSDGAYVHYQLDRRPSSSVVTIDGRRARVRTVSGEGRFAYHALVTSPRMKTGGRYTVEIRVKTRRTRVLRERLVVRRRHAPAEG
jgi:hypothetical protein